MTISDIVIFIVILIILSAAIWKISRDRKKGSTCSGCSGCPVSGHCAASAEHVKDQV